MIFLDYYNFLGNDVFLYFSSFLSDEIINMYFANIVFRRC